MPFDYEAYQKKCDGLSTEELHREMENYTRQLAGGATSTATSVLFAPFTAGISLVGLGLSAPRVHNARKKREIIEAGLEARGLKHSTRKRDVIAPMAVAGTLGTLTLGLAGPGAEIIAGEVVGHGVEYAASHVALDATGAVIEHKHDEHTKKKASQKLQLQYENFQKQYVQQQGIAQPGTNYQPGSSILNVGMSKPEVIQPNEPSSQYDLQKPQQYNKYDSVPIPAPYSPSASGEPLRDDRKTVTQPITGPQENEYPSPPPYSPNHHHENLSGNSDSLSSSIAVELDGTSVIATVPESISMEDEIALLKARILQMELEKRAIADGDSSSSTEKPLAEEVSEDSTSTQNLQALLPPPPSLIVHTEYVQDYPPPPPSPNVSVNSTAMPMPQSLSSSPAPLLHSSSFSRPRPLASYTPGSPNPPLPPRPLSVSISTPQQQPAYPPPPKSPGAQQHPPYQRYDSGYFSNPPSRHTSIYSSTTPQPYTPESRLTPQPTGYSLISPQSSGSNEHGLRHSSSCGTLPYNPVSPISPQSQPYFPPPPGKAGVSPTPTDYFGQNIPPPPTTPNRLSYHPEIAKPIPAPVQPYQGTQGWQWGVAPPSANSKLEPDYGAPPPIPAPYQRQ